MSVYFIIDDQGYVKIGSSKNPICRLHTLQLASRHSLALVALMDGGLKEEKALQRRFRHLCVRNEWFRPGDLELIKLMGAHALLVPVTQGMVCKSGRVARGKWEDCPAKRAIKAAGGAKNLADALGIKSQAISQWRIIPTDRVLDVERLSGIRRTELRPDIYPSEEVAA